MSKQPFMPLFFGDFLASTSEWSGEERALYLLLLAHQWSLGSLPNDIKRLAKLADYERRVFEQHWPMVSTKFVEREDRLYNLRLEQHRDRSIEIAGKRAKAGAIGGSKSAASRQHLPDERSSKPEANAQASAEANATDLLRHPSHPIPSHPIHPKRSHSVARVSGAAELAGAGAPPASPSKELPIGAEGNGVSRPKGTRLPDDFALTPERAAFATEQGVNPPRTHAQFCDFWRAKTGAGATKLDWEATWRNWCRKEADSNPARRGASAADRITWRPTE